MSAQSSPDLLERFKPTTGRWLGGAGLLMLAFVGWSVASTGFDSATVAILAAVALLMVLDWAALVRPSVAAYDTYLFVRNSWSDLVIPWSRITDLDVKQTLHVYAGADRHHGVAIGKSARSMLRGGQKSRSMGSAVFGQGALADLSLQPTLEGASSTGVEYPDFVVLKLQTYVSLQREKSEPGAPISRHPAWSQIILAAVLAAAFVVAVAVGVLL